MANINTERKDQIFCEITVKGGGTAGYWFKSAEYNQATAEELLKLVQRDNPKADVIDVDILLRV